jgi:DNA-binding response OmpR family regulator
MKNQTFTKLAVLVSDPSPHMATLIASMLRAIGVRDITTTVSLFDTANDLRINRFDVIMILDRADDWDGLEIVRAVRKSKDGINRSTPIIMMSRAPDMARIRAARDAGVTEFLRKPFAATDVAKRLSAMLAGPRDFIDVEEYSGPDRRRRPDDNFPGTDRRQAH